KPAPVNVFPDRRVSIIQALLQSLLSIGQFLPPHPPQPHQGIVIISPIESSNISIPPLPLQVEQISFISFPPRSRSSRYSRSVISFHLHTYCFESGEANLQTKTFSFGKVNSTIVAQKVLDGYDVSSV